jgi:hypothetical protein
VAFFFCLAASECSSEVACALLLMKPLYLWWMFWVEGPVVGCAQLLKKSLFSFGGCLGLKGPLLLFPAFASAGFFWYFRLFSVSFWVCLLLSGKFQVLLVLLAVVAAGHLVCSWR